MGDGIYGLVAMRPHFCENTTPQRWIDRDVQVREIGDPTYWCEHLGLVDCGDGLLVTLCNFIDIHDARRVLLDIGTDQYVNLNLSEVRSRLSPEDSDLWKTVHLAPWPGGRRPSSLPHALTLTDPTSPLDRVQRVKATAATDGADDSRISAIVTFTGADDSEEQESGVFAKAATYFAQHHELAVETVGWRQYDSADGRQFALDVEVIPPQNDR